MSEDVLQAKWRAAKAEEAKAEEAKATVQGQVRAAEEVKAARKASIGQLEPTAINFDGLALRLVQEVTVQDEKILLLQGRVRDAEEKLAGARQAVQDAEEAIRVAQHEQLDQRAGELDQKIQDGLKTWEAELRVIFAELRQNRIARNGPNGAWGNGSRWVDVAPPDHPSLFPKALDRWLVNGKPGTAREQDKDAA